MNYQQSVLGFATAKTIFAGPGEKTVKTMVKTGKNSGDRISLYR